MGQLCLVTLELMSRANRTCKTWEAEAIGSIGRHRKLRSLAPASRSSRNLTPASLSSPTTLYTRNNDRSTGAGCGLHPFSFSPNARRSQEMNEAQRKEHERWQEIDAVEVFKQLNSATVHGVPEDGGI